MSKCIHLTHRCKYSDKLFMISHRSNKDIITTFLFRTFAFLSPKDFYNFACQALGFEYSWWRLFQKHTGYPTIRYLPFYYYHILYCISLNVLAQGQFHVFRYFYYIRCVLFCSIFTVRQINFKHIDHILNSSMFI